jgi:hypothetical protein
MKAAPFRDLPSGTVTILFTDIEGSTRLLEALGQRYGEALEAHRRLLREAFAAHGGPSPRGSSGLPRSRQWTGTSSGRCGFTVPRTR